MKHKVFALAIALPLAFGALACHTWFVVDGHYHARWVDRPAYEGHPRYRYMQYAVYEIDGRYYREHEGRWIEYRERPHELGPWQ